jgi:hypothetical protein
LRGSASGECRSAVARAKYEKLLRGRIVEDRNRLHSRGKAVLFC